VTASLHSIEQMHELIKQSEMFDASYYLAENLDVANAAIDPLQHYLEFGWAEGRRPTPVFDPKLYLTENPDVKEANVEPFFHYVVQGVHEGRRVPQSAGLNVSPMIETKPKEASFDPEYYLSANPDVAGAGVDPEWHYVNFGEKEGRFPNRYFDPLFYAQVNPDVSEARVGLFKHFCEAGWKEGRQPSNPAKDLSSFKRGKNILFIGHDAIQAGAQRVLLSIVKWFAEHTDYNVYTLLCDVGPLTSEYSRYSNVFVCNNYRFTEDGRLDRLREIKWDLVYANTVRSGAIASELLNSLSYRAPVVAHIHELENVLAEFPRELESLVSISMHWIVVNDDIKEHLISK
jgi:hypothetical protein